MRALEKALEHPTAIPRALGLQLADRIEGDPEALRDLVCGAATAGQSGRGGGAGDPAPVPYGAGGAVAGEGARGAEGRAAGQGDRWRCRVGPGVRCTATQGKMELRADMDFATLDRGRLEAAIEAFFRALKAD